MILAARYTFVISQIVLWLLWGSSQGCMFRIHNKWYSSHYIHMVSRYYKFLKVNLNWWKLWVDNPAYLGHCIRQAISGGDDEQIENYCSEQVSNYSDEAHLCLAVHQVNGAK